MSAMVDPSGWIERAVRQHPDRLFMSIPGPHGREYSYRDLREESGRYASALRALGVTPGDRVVVRVEKSPQAVLLYVACLLAGAAFVPVNTAYSMSEVEYFLRDSKARVAVVDPADLAAVEPVARGAGVGHVVGLGADGEGSFIDLARRSATLGEPERSVGPDSLAAIVYTSGTTGRSKGAMLTRRNLSSNATVLADSWHFTGEDVLLHILPLFHVHGLFAAINTVLAAGAGMVLMSKFDAAAALRHLSSDVTVLMGVPTHYTRLLQEPGLNRDSTARMRLFVSGSAPLLAETHQEFSQRTGHMILERYGMTETLMNTSNPYEGARVPGSVGPPLPGISVRVVAAEQGTDQSAANAIGVPTIGTPTIGTLEIRGPNVFAGYWGDPEKTRAEFTSDGWFKTGDLGRIDANGYVHIVGRVKDLVITGGYNVYPKEVETELDAVPGVLESAVFGVPHADFGEGVTAAVVLQPGAKLAEAQIIAAVRSRLAGYKIPKRVLFVPELPRNTMGKVQKNVLRATHANLYKA
jgi:malonyl-CoA/methylmalonyl-CoA synthetase